MQPWHNILKPCSLSVSSASPRCSGCSSSKKWFRWCSHSAPSKWICPSFTLAYSAAQVDLPAPGGPTKMMASAGGPGWVNQGEVSNSSTSTPAWSAKNGWYAVSLRRFDAWLPRPAVSRLTGNGLASKVSFPRRKSNRRRPKSAMISTVSPSRSCVGNSGARSNFGDKLEENTCSPVSAKSTSTGWTRTSLPGWGIGWQPGHWTRTPNNNVGELDPFGKRKIFTCHTWRPWNALRAPRAKAQHPWSKLCLRRMMPRPLGISKSMVRSLQDQSMGTAFGISTSAGATASVVSSSSSMSSSSASSPAAGSKQIKSSLLAATVLARLGLNIGSHMASWLHKFPCHKKWLQETVTLVTVCTCSSPPPWVWHLLHENNVELVAMKCHLKKTLICLSAESNLFCIWGQLHSSSVLWQNEIKTCG